MNKQILNIRINLLRDLHFAMGVAGQQKVVFCLENMGWEADIQWGRQGRGLHGLYLTVI